MSNRYLQLNPANVPPNQEVSYKGGNPIVSFDIASSPSDLIGASVRLCGNLSVTTDGATAAVLADTLAMDSRLGVLGLFSDVVLSSQRTKQTIEHIRHYNRFMASYLPLTASNEDLVGHLQEAALTLPSTEAQRISVVNQAQMTNGGEFCIYLPTGLLQSGLIPLDAIGGLSLDLHLSPDSQVLFDTEGNAVGNGYSNAQYKLTNLKLMCEVHDRSPEENAEASRRKMDGFEYNSISAYYSTMNNSNAILNYSLGLSRVRSVFMNFIQASSLQNLNQNSLATIMPMNSAGALANVNQVVFTKGGVRYPANWNLDTNYKENTSLGTPVDPQVARNLMNAIMPFSQMNRNQLSPVNLNRRYTSNDNDTLRGGQTYGIGVSYSNIAGVNGADFSNTPWGVQIDLGLTDDNPISAFVFVHAKQTLLFGEGGIQVIS